MIAGQATSIDYTGYDFGQSVSQSVLVRYVSQANMIKTLGDKLLNAGISWKYYDSPMDPQGIDGAITIWEVST